MTGGPLPPRGALWGTPFAGRRFAVVGLGHVGLPLAMATADAGFRTVGLDADPSRLARLAAGERPLRHVPASAVRRSLIEGRFRTGDAGDEHRQLHRGRDEP